MSKSFWEQKLLDYKNSHTLEVANLEYLDLAGQENIKNRDLAHNLHILCYRNDLGNKVTLAAIHKCSEDVIKELRLDNAKLQKDLRANKAAVLSQQQTIQELIGGYNNLQKEIVQLKKIPKPLSKEDVEGLVIKISEQPKFIEKQTEALIEELSSKVNKIEALIHRLERVLLA
uniref:Uncharacterized protein n=1 Tax=Canna yellow mottle virus TaxID=419782 RepID=A0A2R4FZS7_9VIRU|nr:hypothetical protein [Canna yellow mottle virus]